MNVDADNVIDVPSERESPSAEKLQACGEQGDDHERYLLSHRNRRYVQAEI